MQKSIAIIDTKKLKKIIDITIFRIRNNLISRKRKYLLKLKLTL